ncbi:hypothetical protein PAAL109150_14770 [Paenibacillus alkaliterrae]
MPLSVTVRRGIEFIEPITSFYWESMSGGGKTFNLFTTKS